MRFIQFYLITGFFIFSILALSYNVSYYFAIFYCLFGLACDYFERGLE